MKKPILLCGSFVSLLTGCTLLGGCGDLFGMSLRQGALNFLTTGVQSQLSADAFGDLFLNLVTDGFSGGFPQGAGTGM